MYCEENFESKCVMDDFCSEECRNTYWKNPEKVLISSTCPGCDKKFEREIFTVELRGYQALTMCPDCNSREIMFIYPTARYVPQQEEIRD